MYTNYCAQCMIFLNIEGASYFKGRCKEGEAWSVECAGCGPVLVNHEGECLSNCEDEHGSLDANLESGNYLIFPNGRIIKDNRNLTGETE